MISDQLIVKLDKLTYGGDALGRLSDGRAVFVPFALPGETVCIQVRNEKGGHVRAELLDVLEPSPARITPKCRHFGVCGGCHYQHMSYKDQLAAKTEILRDQLLRIGKIQDPLVKQIVASPDEWNYRNQLQFHLSPDGKLGYIDIHQHSVMPICECHLPELSLNSLWPRLEFDPGLGLERITLRLGAADEILMVLESESPDPPELELGADLSVVHLTEDDVVVMAGDDHLSMAVNGRLFHVSAASFFQVNTGVAGRMVAHLQDHIRVHSSTTLLDVFCGVGLFSAFFAPLVGRLVGIEASASACNDFAINLDEFDSVDLYQALAEDVLPALEDRSGLIILDPPRAGLEKRALEALLGLEPTSIAYVSCDPATLARDASRLIAGGYRLLQVTPFDLFPQTYHLESISIFEKG